MIAARKKAKEVPRLKGVFISEDLTDMRYKMCGVLRKCGEVKKVITNNGFITCFLHEKEADGKNKTVKIKNPDDMAKLMGVSVLSIWRRLGLTDPE